MKYVYKITYPNRKIYIGMDLVDEITYFGSVNHELVAKDFTWEERQKFTVTKEILWSSDTASDKEVNAIERKLIAQHQANNPDVGYNRMPKFKD